METNKTIKIKKETFAKGVCFDKLLIVFIIGSIFGAYYEQIFELVRHWIEDGTIFWEYRRGVIYGPFNVIYGFGAALMVYLLIDRNHKWYQTLFYGSLLGGAVEYMLHFLQQVFTQSTSWDYSDKFLNIGGRTTIPYMIFWGLLCLIFVKIIYPFLSKYIEKIPYQAGKLFTRFMVIFLALDMFISWTALIRQAIRKEGYQPITPVGVFYDKYYDDDMLARYFPNMVHKKG